MPLACEGKNDVEAATFLDARRILDNHIWPHPPVCLISLLFCPHPFPCPFVEIQSWKENVKIFVMLINFVAKRIELLKYLSSNGKPFK
jgi:hypothetical protein